MPDSVRVPPQFEPIFRKAQEYVESYFSSLSRDPAKGTITISGERYILVRAASMSVEFMDIVRGLYQSAGDEAATAVARQFLYDVAHSIGMQDARNFHEKMEVADPIEKLSAGPIHFAHSGWAFVEISPESTPTPDEGYCLVYDHPFSFEAAAWEQAGKRSGFPVCVMNAGYSSGWCEESFGLPLAAAEILCKARGDEACRFIMAPPARIQGRIEGYLNKTVPAGRKVVYEIPGFFQRKELEERLRQERDRAQQYLDIAGVLIVALDAGGRVALINQKTSEVLGIPETEAVGKDWFECFLPHRNRAEVRSFFDDVMAGRRSGGEQFESPILAKDGGERLIEWRNAWLKDKNGTITGVLSSGMDVTGKRETEQQLSLSRQQLFESQKLDAVGRLAGGIAHDFNNILTAIGAYAEFLMKSLDPGDARRADVDEIKRAGERAAGLTQQLLAYSRKQVLQPRVLNLNAIVTDVARLLHRTLGEDIAVVSSLDPTLGLVKADATQLSQVVLNLAVNARDAMPQGGKLLIESSNMDVAEPLPHGVFTLPPARYAVLTISDTGCGMSDEVQRHLFEPFFTTKERGKGTGLGLATVYGIVKQSGGYISIYSAAGRGTTIRIYLPRAVDAGEELPVEETSLESLRGRETILLAEDDDAVRRTAMRILRNCGYRIIETRDGDEAVQAAGAETGKIHLLLTDVVMPKMDGRGLAEKLCPGRPEMKVLFMSGYTDAVIAQKGILEPGTAFLHKPFAPTDLARKVRQVLDTP